MHRVIASEHTVQKTVIQREGTTLRFAIAVAITPPTAPTVRQGYNSGCEERVQRMGLIIVELKMNVNALSVFLVFSRLQLRKCARIPT
jgi:hypothetical protein